MPKTSLTIYLIKQGKEPEEAIKGLVNRSGNKKAHKPAPIRRDIPGIGTFYYRPSSPHQPAWVEEFFAGTIDKKPFNTSNAAAVLLVKISDRFMAIVFGQGRHLLNTDATEDRFGLKTVLNMGDSPSFRKVDSTSVAGNAGKTSEQLPKLSDLTEFAIDSVTDTLDKVTVKIDEDDLFSGTICGGQALTLSTNQNVHTITDLLVHILERYQSDEYKKVFPWVDNVSPVKDQSLISSLEDIAVKAINERRADFWTAPPDLIEWNRVAGFKIEGRRKELFDDIAIEDVLGSFRNGLNTYDQLRNKRVHVVDAHDKESVLFSWSISNCLYGETSIEGEPYCMNAGKWYHISRKYALSVNEEYMQTACYDGTAFPVCGNGEHEGPYNKRLAASNKSFLLMDAKNISYGAPHSKVELCDILYGNDIFIHVKHGGSSAPLSHLFAQGYNSAYLVKGDSSFVEKANEKISQQTNGHEHKLTVGNVRYVIFAIISKKPGQPPDIPFFSRISYNEAKRHLQVMGVEARICSISKASD